MLGDAAIPQAVDAAGGRGGIVVRANGAAGLPQTCSQSPQLIIVDLGQIVRVPIR